MRFFEKIAVEDKDTIINTLYEHRTQDPDDYTVIALMSDCTLEMCSGGYFPQLLQKREGLAIMAMVIASNTEKPESVYKTFRDRAKAIDEKGIMTLNHLMFYANESIVHEN